MSRPESAHDKLFGEAFASPEAIRGLLKGALPAELYTKLDLASLKPVPGTFIDEALVGSQSDLLFQATFAGRPALIYFLIEHKSTVERWVALQLLRYLVRIWERILSDEQRPSVLPPIIPLVVYHGQARWSAPMDLLSLLDPVAAQEPTLQRLTPRFEYLLDDLSAATDEQLLSRAMGLFAGLAAIFLRDARAPERVVPMVKRVGALLGELWRAPDGRRAVAILLRYLWLVGDASQEEVAAVVEKHLPESKELIMTIAERLLQQGLEQGLERGREEGRVEGRVEGMRAGRLRTLRRQLELKFGALEVPTLRKLESLGDEALEACAERVLTALTLDELLLP